MTWQPPSASLLEGQHITLERLDPLRHAPNLYAISHNGGEYEEIFRFLFFGPFKDLASFQTYLTAESQRTDALTYALFSRQMSQYVGMLSIINIVPEMGRAELGSIWVGKPAHRGGLTRQATFLLLTYLFDTLHYRRVEWKCDNDNAASKTAALRMGFQFEGLFRKHMLVKGNNRDTAWYALIDDDWPTARASFQSPPTT